MPLSAAQFLEIVARNHHVPAAVIGMLRQQLAAAPQAITAAALAKYLVDGKHLPPAAANLILATAESLPVQPAAKPQPQPEDELGLAPDDELDDLPRPKPGPAATSASPLTVPTVVTQPVANRPPSIGVPVSQVQAFSEDELGLAPDEDEKSSPKPKTSGPVGAPITRSIGVTAVTPVAIRPVAVTPIASVATPVAGIAPVKAMAAVTPVKPAASPSNARNAPNSPANRPTAAKPAAMASPKQPAAGNRNRPVPARTHLPEETADPLVEHADEGDGLFADLGDTGLQALTGEAALDAPANLLARPRPDRRVSRKQNRWIVGGATAVVLLGLIGILVSASLRSNGEPEFASAEKAYEARDNQAAIGKFTEFLEGFSRHPRASVARVHLAMSKLRLATADERDWPEALPKIPLILTPIARQSEFQPAQVEVAAVLTRIAEKLTDSAVKATEPQESRLRLEAACEAVRLVNEPRYVPGELHNDQLLQELAERLTLLEYNLDRSVMLEATSAAMTKALAAHDLAAAYAARQELVDRYPNQSRANSLLEMGRRLAAESLRQVKVTKEARAAVTQDVSADVTATLVLAAAPATPAPGDKVAACFALIRGTVYALDAGTGRILWRRPIGGDIGDGAGRMPVAIDGTTDVLLVDARDHSLLRLDAITGKLRWRQVVGQPLLEPVAAGDRIFVATRDGLILSLDATSGQSDLQAQLPQPLALPLVAASDGQTVIALAEHSHLYTLSAADLACRKVTYLGHDPGTIEAPPLILPKHLLVAENRGDAHSLLRVFGRGGEATAELELQGIPLAGQVISPLASDAGHVAVGTESGPTYVFELTGRADAPLKKLAELSASHEARTVRYLAVQNGRLWVADAGLYNYALAALSGRAKSAWQGFALDPVVQPLQITRELVIVGRHDAENPGVLISAVAAGGGSPVWETRLGAPPVTPWIAADNASLVVARADGNIYQIDTAASRGLVRCQPLALVREEQPVASLGRTTTVTQCLPIGADQVLLLRGPAAAAVVSLSDSAIRPYALPGALLCPPTSIAGGLLAVCQPGEVYLLRTASSRRKVEPFMPLVRPADSPAWHLAGAQLKSVQTSGERPLSVVVRGKQLFAMGLRSEPLPHLAAVGTAELPAPLDAAPAIAEKLVCAADQAGNLQTFLLPELKPGPAWNPGSKVAWGPCAAGPVFVAATDDGHLHCFDAKQQQPKWKIKLSHAPLTSVCAVGEQLFLASQDGILSRVSLETGAEQGTQDLGEPLGEGLLSAGPALIVVSAEGSLLKVTAP